MALRDLHVLVVEDDYLLAIDLQRALTDAGLHVLGPEPSVVAALACIDAAPRIDAAVLDVNLGDEAVFPVADELRRRGIPFLFASGYGEDVVATCYPGVPHCSKPLDMRAVLRTLEAVTPHAT